MRETAQGCSHRLQDAVPYRVGDQIPPQDPCRGNREILASQAAGGAEILSRLAFHGDWDRQGSCARAHGDPTEIQRQFCGGDDEEEHEPGIAGEVSVLG